MQPAYYENLDEIQKKLWSMLDDAVVNRSSPFRIPVFICANQNDIDGRIVVLRKSDKENNVLQFHTDLRSQKVDILMKNKNASLVFYDKEETIQLRTYERGVENETLSCGTGAVAAALSLSIVSKSNLKKVSVKTLGGDLFVEFKNHDNNFYDIYLSGKVKKVFSGEINYEEN